MGDDDEMTKAALCTHCFDIVAPYRDWQTKRDWRWCQCDHMAVRWRDGTKGLLEVSAVHGPDFVRVLGFNNAFLGMAVTTNPQAADGVRTSEQWRALHDELAAMVEPHYLFHKDKRNCWALVVRVGESSDVFFIDYATAKGWGPPPTAVVEVEGLPAIDRATTPGN